MAEPLDPQYEAEIRDRIEQLDTDRTFPTATWLASSVNSKSVLPPEQSHVVEDVLQTDSFVTRASVGVFGDKRHAEFTAHARDDVPALLDEIDRLRKELEQVSSEIARFGIYGAPVPATKALVKRADELVTENAELKAAAGQSRAEVVAERDAQIIAWLCKKAHEYGVSNRENRAKAEAVGRMADKLSRGAVRPTLGTEGGNR